jgi:signal transduction histidine kinase
MMIGRRPRRVLLVDDDEVLRASMCEGLEGAGFDVEEVADGRAALERLERAPAPEVIVLDLSMPVMNGWEFRVEQRRREAAARIPVVVVTGDPTPPALAIDAAVILCKPFSMDALRAAIEEALAAGMERQLAQTEKMASIGLLAASLAHEINNPLSYVLSNLEFALEGLSPYELSHPARGEVDRAQLGEIAAALRDAAAGAKRVRALARDLRDFARTQPGDRQALDVRPVLRGAAKMVAHEVQQRAQLVEELHETPPVLASEAKLGQVFVNLILNAAQALPRGKAREHRITLRVQAEKEWVVAEVHDTGSGIPPEVAPHIFEPFFTTKPAGEGTGLGLFICRRELQALDGDLEFEGAPGAGSVFRVRLPAAR